MRHPGPNPDSNPDIAQPPYDVLLDDYEKGMTAARLTEIFDEVGSSSGLRMAAMRSDEVGLRRGPAGHQTSTWEASKLRLGLPDMEARPNVMPWGTPDTWHARATVPEC